MDPVIPNNRKGHWDENRCWIPDNRPAQELQPQSNPNFVFGKYNYFTIPVSDDKNSKYNVNE